MQTRIQKISTIHVEVVILNKKVISSAHKKGIRVIPWTVNTKEEIDQLKKMGVDGIITDYPDLFD